MALQSLFRAIFKQLKRLTRPIPLVSGVAIASLAIFVSEYISHPEWFGTYSPEEEEPSQSLDLSGLTPEEQAAVADIDNLSVLFSDLGGVAQGNPTIRAVPEAGETSQPSLFEDLTVLNRPGEADSLSSQPNPFEQYLSQYQFGQPSRNSTLQTPDVNVPTLGNATGASPNNGLLVPALPLQAAATPSPGQTATSALERAINSRNTVSPANKENADLAGESSSGNGVRSLEGTQTSSNSASSSENASSQLTSEQNSRAVTIPGLPFPFLPTTPEMSPPPGTTGYTPPASLQPTQPSSASSNPTSFPNAGTLLPPAGSAGVPSIPSAGSTPNLTAPQVDISNGAVAPSLPSTIQPSATNGIAAPPPSSVPRAPGSYTGNGYINTFSNPSGPPQ